MYLKASTEVKSPQLFFRKIGDEALNHKIIKWTFNENARLHNRPTEAQD